MHGPPARGCYKSKGEVKAAGFVGKRLDVSSAAFVRCMLIAEKVFSHNFIIRDAHNYYSPCVGLEDNIGPSHDSGFLGNFHSFSRLFGPFSSCAVLLIGVVAQVMHHL